MATQSVGMFPGEGSGWVGGLGGGGGGGSKDEADGESGKLEVVASHVT